MDLDGHAAEAIDQTHVAVRRLGQFELLVGAVPVAPLHDLGAGGLRPVAVVQHLAGVPVLQLVVPVTCVDEPPLLVGPAVTGPLHHRRAVVRGELPAVQHLAAVAVDQHVPRLRIHGSRRGRVDHDRGAGHDSHDDGRPDTPTCEQPTATMGHLWSSGVGRAGRPATTAAARHGGGQRGTPPMTWVGVGHVCALFQPLHLTGPPGRTALSGPGGRKVAVHQKIHRFHFRSCARGWGDAGR